MRHLALLSLLLALGCVHVHSAPVEQDGLEQLSCEDASAKAAAGLALTKINQDRQDGYIFALHRLSNAHMRTHGENGVVFYLSVDVAETNCSVLSRKDWKKDCEVRSDSDNPVYGQCKAAIYISKVNRVVRLYKYQCLVRPVPAARVGEICPDCPTHVDVEGKQVQKAVSLSLDKFNKESSFPNRFILLKVLSANSGMGGMGNMYYNAHYTIQETACPKTTEAGTDCPPMTCEFAHKGFCKGSLWQTPTGDDDASVECEIYEPEAADREKNMHILGGETDHSHNDTHMHDHDHDHAHTADGAHTHDHVHDHTKPHEDHTKTHEHSDTSDHHHTHDHAAGSGHSHAHAHSHDHGHGHDHVHAHHAKAHDHSGDTAGHHHDYKHADGDHTHHHDHELALDHDHKHAHLHEHEHHHHHDKHEHETAAHDHPEGEVKSIGAMGEPMMMPIFNDAPPMVGVTLIAKEDPQIPGEMEPVIESHFPKSISAQCAAPLLTGPTLVEKLLSEDTLFKGDPWA